MNVRTITIDGIIVVVTYDDNGRLLSVTSTNPVFVFLFGPEVGINVGGELDYLTGSIRDVLVLFGILPPPAKAA